MTAWPEVRTNYHLFPSLVSTQLSSPVRQGTSREVVAVGGGVVGGTQTAAGLSHRLHCSSEASQAVDQHCWGLNTAPRLKG